MKTSGPPALATWLMTRLSSGEKSESMIGDLIEQYQHGRSSLWYWRQAITAIVFGFGAEMSRNSAISMWVIAAGAYVPQAIWFIVWPAWLVRLDAWYPLLIHTRLSWMVINPWAYRLRLDALTSTILFCAFLAAIAWGLTRLHPRQRGLVVTLFLFTQVGLCVPALRSSLANWLHEPDDPIRFYQALWFSIFMFVETPASILYGAYGWRSRSSAKICFGPSPMPPGGSSASHKDDLRRQRRSALYRKIYDSHWAEGLGFAGQTQLKLAPLPRTAPGPRARIFSTRREIPPMRTVRYSA